MIAKAFALLLRAGFPVSGATKEQPKNVMKDMAKLHLASQRGMPFNQRFGKGLDRPFSC